MVEVMGREIDDLEWSEVKRRHFFKVLVGDFKRCLIIPPKFVKNVITDNEGETDDLHATLSKTAMLEGPSGRIWHVKIEKRDGYTYFAKGWDKFARDHVLEEHEFLVFRYSGNLHFNVLIFDTSACEKDDSFPKEKISTMANCRHERENREKKTVASVIQQEKTKLNKGCEMPVNSEKKNKEKNKFDTDCEVVSNRENEIKRKEKEKEVEEINFEEIRKFASDCKNLATKKRARDFELETFDRRKKFTKTDTFCDLSKEIKKEFVDEFGNSSPDSNITTNKEGNNTSSTKKNIIIIDEEEISKMEATNEECRNQERVSEVLRNEPEKEIEELVRRGDGEMEVEDPNYEKIRKFAKDCENLATKKRPKDVELKSFLEGKRKFSNTETSVDLTKEVKKECVDEFGNSSPDSNITTTNKEGNNSKDTSHPKEKTSIIDDEVQEITINEMPFHARSTTKNSYGRVKIEENLKALDSAMTFKSKFPSFVLHMTKSNAGPCNHARFPAEFWRNYLPRNSKEGFILRDSSEKEWVVSYVVRNNRESAVISKGWPLFKREHLLKEDDCCVFELVKPREFRVHIYRA